MTTLSFQPDADRYYAEGHWRPGDLWDDFAARAHAQPDKLALVLDDRRVTYDELRRAAVALSARLAARSVQPGDVVVLLGRHSIEAAVAMLGCLHRGVVLAPLPPMFNVTQLVALARQTGARAIVGFGGEKELAKCEQAAPIVEHLISLLPATLDELIAEDASDERGERGADDIAMVMHSSGTTSAPKGIVHSSNTLRYATEGICGRWRLGGDDVYLVATEFGFVGGMVFGYLPVLLNGGTGVLMSRWKPDEALRLIEEHRCTYVLLMPTHAADTLVAAQATTRDLSSMRVLAAPGLTPERRLAMQDAFGIPPLADYGLSEVPGHAAHALQEPEAKMLTTEGRPYDGTEIRIVDRNGAPLPAGQVGDVVVNGPSRFLFFLGNDELTRNSLTSWGGYHTGDLGYLDDDGHLVYVGPEQGHHQARWRDGGAGRARAGADAPPCDPRGRGRPAARRAPRRAGVRRAHPQERRAGADARRAAGVPRARGRRQVHVAGVDRGLRRVSAHPVAEGGQARGRAADRLPQRRSDSCLKWVQDAVSPTPRPDTLKLR